MAASDEAAAGPQQGPPRFDASAVGRVVPRVQIQRIELVGAHFERADDAPLPDLPDDSSGVAGGAAAGGVDVVPDQLRISVDWDLNTAGSRLGVLIGFATGFSADAGDDASGDVDADDASGSQPYEVVAQYRLLYAISMPEGADPPSGGDLEQFAYWNAVFQAFPYWREYLSSTIDRAHLPRFTAPVMRMPKAN